MDGDTERLLLQIVPNLNPPGPNQKVYKDECMFSFDTPESESGLYVCLKTFWGLGKDYVEQHVRNTRNYIFLHIRQIKHKKPNQRKEANNTPEKVTRLAIGMEGGFQPELGDGFEIEEILSIVLFPGHRVIQLPNPALPEKLLNVVNQIMAAESARKLAELESMCNTWDGEARKPSKHSETLLQLDNGKKVQPRDWRCEAEGCDKRDNLWLNLTDGSILCGRKLFDGSGGNNHALEHYAEVKYPLAVKLGTITPDGNADVFSYDEDDMVIDAQLVKHLKHFGIDVEAMQKTEKSMAEMEIELNMKHVGEINALTESGKTLKPMRGPGLTGIVNLGNSCYMNSIMQCLFSIPEFSNRFARNAEKYFEMSNDPVNDFNVQMSKFCLGLSSGKYCSPLDPDDPNSDAQVGISPYSFKALIGKGHKEFSTKRQQDAQEFFHHVKDILIRHSRTEENPFDCFKFQVEDRLQCDASKCVKYTYRYEYCLPFSIPLEEATNIEAVAAYEKRKAEAAANKTTLAADDIVRYKIPFECCIESFIRKETLQFKNPVTDILGTASKWTRLSSFPDYLVIQLKKFCYDEEMKPKKLDVSVEMPEVLDLSALRAVEPEVDELKFPEVPQSDNKIAVDESVVAQLMEMGFQPNACRRAVISSGNIGAQGAMNWIMSHMDDPDLNDPIQTEYIVDAPSNFIPNETAMQSIQSMGFTAAQAKKALQNTDNNIERAVDWIFSHTDEIENETENSNCTSQSSKQSVKDGPSKYKLMGFVSHMGPSTMVGHYVVHLWKDNSWVLFNDNRVAASESLPKDLGYLYFYRRV